MTAAVAMCCFYLGMPGAMLWRTKPTCIASDHVSASFLRQAKGRSGPSLWVSKQPAHHAC
jgi:hypothetical protein